MFDAARSLLSDGDFAVVERFDLPERPARYASLPRFLFDSRVGYHFNRSLKALGGKPWLHQAEALEALGHDENVVVSTGTASGKSLIFRAMAFHKALLAPESRTLIFYPLKALAADQMPGWEKMARELELPDSFVGRIDGSVPVKDRENVLSSSRIVVMTPDVCHAWLMYRLALPAVRKFVQALSTLVMDEAHTLEGVFGSNFAFLIRRIIAARTHLTEGNRSEIQLVAATATIRDPADHMKLLTGKTFTAIDHERDGSPQHRRSVAHVGCPDGEELAVARELHTRLMQSQQDGAFITFLDSRKGVEALAVASGAAKGMGIDTADVLPYRAGYDVDDRAAIEGRLQAGSLKGVISTSALELGIDLPHLQVGINIGVPAARKSYRQRLGRVGRNGPGCFLIVAPPQAFSGFGTSLREYHDLSVEPSYLYLDNRFMQFAHGRCLAMEQESLGAPLRPPKSGDWPSGFNELYAAACPGGNRPTEFDAIANLGGDNPHRGYPLRNVGELNYQIKFHKDADSIGDLNQVQALREGYPGGTYLHLAKAYEVKGWVTSAFDAYIRVGRTNPRRRTRPRIKTWVNAGVGNAVQDGNLLTGTHGFLAESMMQITQRVEGYVDEHSGTFHDYRELQQRDPNLRAQSRNFRTTGVVLGLDNSWFRNAELKCAFATKLHDVFVREYSIAARDIGVAWSNISVQQWNGNAQRGCVAVFDETYGSLRLTERVFDQFEHLLDRMVAGARADEDDELREVVSRVKDELETFAGDAIQQELQEAPTGYEQVFTPGSTVCHRKAGAIAVDVRILQPAIIDDALWYQVEIRQKAGQSPAKRWIRASDVEPSAIAADWNYGWWNLATQEYEDPPEARDETDAIVKASPELVTERGGAEIGHQHDESAWRERIKAGLAAQVEAGGKIYGYRRDGAYVVRTKDGDEITTPGHANR